MGINKNSQFTALTAQIKMAGIKVGALQTLTIDENWNMTRVGEIGSVTDIRHVPGRYQVNLTARRMFVERDLVMSALAPFGGEAADFDNIQTDIVSNTVPLDSPDDAVADAQAAGAALTRDEKVFHYSFDVEILDAAGNVIMTARECSITSRRHTIDQGAIVVAEDVNMIAKYVSLGDGKTSSFTGLGDATGSAE